MVLKIFVLPIISLLELLIHRVWPVRIPGALCCGALDAAKYKKYMVSEKNIFKVFS